MKCLQCGNDATETGETAGSIEIRECGEGHRTGQATAAMIKRSNADKRAALKAMKSGTVEYTPQSEAA